MLFNESWKNFALGILCGEIILLYGIEAFSLLWWIWVSISFVIIISVIGIYNKVKNIYDKRGVL